MPHLTLEYSANLEEWVDMLGLCRHLRDAMVATGVFPLGGVRVRAICCDHVAIADDDPDNGFIHMIARIGHGRDEATRREAAEAIFDAAEAHLAAAFAHSFALSFELVEIDPVTNIKRNAIHDRIKAGGWNG
jgi:5-carboxymethyl-2-hydroxymuconate isomerase